MAERKIFAGTRLKRLRQRLGLSQTQMAAEIGVSPSYLNLIERNQRPLTVQVLLKLSGSYGVDVAELSGDDDADQMEALKEVFADPLLAGELASQTELSELLEAAPNAARGTARLYEAYREALERLSDLSHRMAREGEAPPDAAGRLPFARVAAYFEQAGPHFPEIEAAATEAAEALQPRDDPTEALRSHLKSAHNVDLRILPGHVMPVEQLRFDRHTLRLFLSERVLLMERPFMVARQIAFLGHRALLDQLTSAAGMADPEAARICRSGFARRLAEAILAPAGRLAAAVGDAAPDVVQLSQRFVLAPSRVMARLAALGADPMRSAPPAFVLTLDAAGGVVARVPGAGFPLPRLAPFCARLPLFDDLRPGRVVSATLQLPDGSAFRAVALAEEGTAAAGPAPPPRRLSLIGWRKAELPEAAELSSAPLRPVGVTCRLCEREGCAHRTHPPVAQPAGFYEHAVGASDHEIIG